MRKISKNKKRTKTFNPIRQSWIPIILIIAVFPLTWLIVDGTNWLTTLGIRNFIDQEPSAWTNAFLGYFASAFAAAAGYFAVLLTIYKQEESRREDNRKNVLPLIEVNKSNSTVKTVSNVVTNKTVEEANWNPSNGALFNLKNVGMREMYNVAITNVTCDLLDDQLQEIQISPIIYKDRSLTVRLQPVFVGHITAHKTIRINEREFKCNMEIPAVFTMTFSYKDCYDNLYKQKVKIETSIRANPLENDKDNSITYDVTTIKNIEVLSAPELITDREK